MVVPKSYNAESLGFQPCRSICIRANLLSVLASIKLHNQPLLETHKINNVRTQQLLSSKLVSTQLTNAKMLP